LFGSGGEDKINLSVDLKRSKHGKERVTGWAATVAPVKTLFREILFFESDATGGDFNHVNIAEGFGA
jgi:hypothetical protein